MKYIRTKDGIYEVVKEDGDWIDCVGSFQRIMKCQCCVKKHAIIKQADTIEELCDEFVDIDNHDYYKITLARGIIFALSKTRRFIGNTDIRCKEIGQIMGAIFTDKGIIYIAKMKGVLSNGEIDWELL